MSSKQRVTKVVSVDPLLLNAKILSAEKLSFLFAIPVGLVSGLIAYFAAPIFPLPCSLIVGIGSIAIVSVLLFQFRFSKDLPKKQLLPRSRETPSPSINRLVKTL